MESKTIEQFVQEIFVDPINNIHTFQQTWDVFNDKLVN